VSYGFLFKFERRDVEFDIGDRLNCQAPAGAVHILDSVGKPETRCFPEITLTNDVHRFVICIQQICPHDVAGVAVQEQMPMLTAGLQQFEFPGEDVAEFLHTDHADFVPLVGPLDEQAIWVWELYIFSHLGLAFLIAAVIGTPGCEMRAFHDSYSRLTGVATKEHVCPVGPLHPIDQWEARLRNRKGED